MPSAPLSPIEAARAADRVYEIKDSDFSALSDRPADFTGVGASNNPFAVVPSGRVMGETGGMPILTGGKAYSPSGMALVTARGGSDSQDVLVSVRGTANLFDLATDLDCPRVIGPGGHRVHGGFMDATTAIQQDVDGLIRGMNPRALHFTGHSLGGAIATLLAAHYAHRQRNYEVYLYTFGCPRVGDSAFGDWLVKRISQPNYLRLYHPSDPVPMVGPYPFQQPDFPACKAPSPQESGIRLNYHSMSEVYLNVARDKQWTDFSTDIPSLLSSANIRWWLDTGFASSPITFMSGRIAGLVLDALRFILEQLNAGLSLMLSARLTRHATMLDTLVAALISGYNIGGTMAGWVSTIITTVARLVGRWSIRTENAAAWFIRYIFELFFKELASIARQALVRTLR